MHDRRLYDVLYPVREVREELATLTDADYKFDRIIANYQYYHNFDDRGDEVLVSLLYHSSFEGDTTADGEKLHEEVKWLYGEFDRIIGEDDREILDIEFDEPSGCLMVTFA